MDVVLEKIHYNPDCFSKIVEDFDDFVERAEPGVFQKAFDDFEKSASFPEERLICVTTRNLERALAELQNNPACYLKDLTRSKKYSKALTWNKK